MAISMGCGDEGEGRARSPSVSSFSFLRDRVRSAGMITEVVGKVSRKEG